MNIHNTITKTFKGIQRHSKTFLKRLPESELQLVATLQCRNVELQGEGSSWTTFTDLLYIKWVSSDIALKHNKQVKREKKLQAAGSCIKFTDCFLYGKWLNSNNANTEYEKAKMEKGKL